jgi:peptidase E
MAGRLPNATLYHCCQTASAGLIVWCGQGHNGESREERLAEFLVVNPTVKVVAIREGTGMRMELGPLLTPTSTQCPCTLD